MKKSEELQVEIGKARAKLSVLKAEWAYLNRPERLIHLTNLGFDKILGRLTIGMVVRRLGPRRTHCAVMAATVPPTPGSGAEVDKGESPWKSVVNY